MYVKILSAYSQITQNEWRIRRKKFLLSTMPTEDKGIELKENRIGDLHLLNLKSKWRIC
jgi:hypothetical protein